MAQKASCDRCHRFIANGGGYYFYSSTGEVKLGLKKTGAMLLCEPCTDEIINDGNWRVTKEDLWKIEVELVEVLFRIREKAGELTKAEELEFAEALQRANDASIVGHCTNQEFSPDEAKAKAQEFAKRWWEDPKAAEGESTAFWTGSAKKRKADAEPSKPRSKLGCLIGCGVAFVLLTGACVVTGVIGVVLMEREQTGVRTEAQNILRLIADGKTDDAYKATALAYRAETDEAAFTETIKTLDIAGHTGWEEKRIRHKTGWSLEGFATGPGVRVVPLTMDFVWEGGEWRLRSIRKSAADK